MQTQSGIIAPDGTPAERITGGNAERDDPGGTPVLYLDLMGTLVRESALLATPAEAVIPEAVALVKKYKALGYRICILTNEPGISMGKIKYRDAVSRIEAADLACGKIFDAVTICPHHPSAPRPNDRLCLCRKPKYGLMLMAELIMTQKFGGDYPMAKALVVGDGEEDRLMAKAAGVRFKWTRDWLKETV